ncbi:MAG: iron-sulfur cluster repair di-iron protein [Candidatus Promineofilum sp.]|nr:iron-sulfur cluster repair di-iron protein [Promineifilum sp.]
MTIDTIPNGIAGKMVGDFVAADYRAAAVFDKYGIDFCCEGQTSIDQACLAKGVALETVLHDLEQVEQAPGLVERHDQWALDFLSDYIVNQFHAYTKDMLPRITEYVETVANVHGDTHPETRTIAALWPELKGELAMHMQKEELLLFPYVKRLVRSEAEGTSPAKPPFGSAKDLIEKMEAEHDDTGGVLLEMERVSDGYAPPEDACPTYRTLYAYLKEFDAATKKHVHMENNILFPRTIQLEQTLLAG